MSYSYLETVFALRTVTAVIVGALFAVPVLRALACALPPSDHPLARIVAVVTGRYERAVGWLRICIGVPFLAAVCAWHAYRLQESYAAGQWSSHAIVCAVSLTLIAVSVLFRRLRRRGLIDLVELTRASDAIHPQEFTDRFHAAHGILKSRTPLSPATPFDPLAIDFTGSACKGKRSRIAFLRGACTTMVVTRLIMLAFKLRGEVYAREAASKLALALAARIVQIAHARISIEGGEQLSSMRLPLMYCLNHTSAFDFATLPLVLYAHRRASGIDTPLVACFLLARDHFLDNPLFYRVIGIGRVAKLMDMVFVERRHATRASAENVTHTAAEKLLHGAAPLAIYPQGTRARRRCGLNGERLDAGYYTVGALDRLEREGGHFKKGAAFIAADAARICARMNSACQVSILPVAFVGSATVLPRDSIAVQFGTAVTIRVGGPIVVTASMVEPFKDDGGEAYTAFVNSLNDRIDQSLKTTFRAHADLERRFFEDIRGAIDAHMMEELSLALKQWRKDDYLVYVILDFIYACKPKEWRPLLGRLAHLILNDAPRAEFVELRREIARKLAR